MANDVKLTKKHPNYKNQDSNDHITASGNVKNTVTGLAGHDTFDGGKGQDTLVIKADWADAKITETADGFKIKIGSDWIKVSDVEKFKFNDGTFSENNLINKDPTGASTFVVAGATEDASFTVNASDLLQGFKDAKVDTLSISGLTADNATVVDNHDGTFTITPAADFNGNLTLSYSVDDSRGGSIAATNVVAVAAVNDAPTVATPISDATASEGVAFSFAVPAGTFADVDGDTLTLTATLANGDPLPAWLTFDAATGTFTGTPTDGTAGTVSVKVSASDGTLSASDTFDIVVGDTIKTLTTTNGDTIVLTSATETVNGDSTTFQANDLIIDSTSGDNDTLALTLTAAGAAATVQNIENVNVNWNAFGAASYDASKTTGATITVSSSKLGYLGDVNVTFAGANKVVAGTGAVGTLTVTGATTSVVDAGAAKVASVTSSGTPANDVSVALTAGANTTTLTTSGFVTSNVTGGAATTAVNVTGQVASLVDVANVTLAASGSVTQASVETLNITAADKTTVTLGSALAATANTITSSGAVTLAANGAQLSGLSLTNSTAGLTIDFTSSAADDLSKIGFNTLNVKNALAGALTVASGSNVRTDFLNFAAANNLQATTGTADTVTLTSTVDQSKIDVTGAKGIETLNFVNALAATDGDHILTIGSLSGTTVNITGSDKTSIGGFAVTTLDAHASTGAFTATQGTVGDVTVLGSSTAANILTFIDTTQKVTYTGGSGDDTVGLASTTGAVTLTLGDGTNAVTAAALTTAVVNVTGGAGADSVTLGTTTGSATLTLGDGANTVTANGLTTGTLEVHGGAGVDTVTVTTTGAATVTAETAGGDDVVNLNLSAAANETIVLQLGDGNDTVKLGANSNAGDNHVFDGGAGTDTLDLNGMTLKDGNVNLTGFETILDSTGGSKIAASFLAGQSYLIQGNGNIATQLDVDVTSTSDGTYNFSSLTLDGTLAHGIGGLLVTGNTGADSITGTSGADAIDGAGGNDVIVGGAGADVITGGAGSDVLTGGIGTDTFVFGNTDSTLVLATADKITDFTAADDSLSVGIAGVVGGAAATYVEATSAVADFAAALTAANTALAALDTASTATELFSFQFDGTNGYLFDDTDGNGTADQVFILTGIDNTKISEADLVV